MATVQPSRVFSAYRAAGFISNHVPLVLQVKGAESFVTTAVGKAFHVYNCSKLNLLFVGEIQEENISLLSSHGEFTVTSSQKTIRLWKRGKLVKEYDQHSAEIHLMLPFGEHVISVDEENVAQIWNVNSLDTYLTLQFSRDDFNVTTALHPSTYLNKILFGSREGSMQLWNIKTSKLIYVFSGWSEPILVLEQAPAVDVVAIGLQSGKIVLHNLKYDEVLMTFLQEFGPVTAISFRTDNAPIMATGSTAGHVSLWDLEKRKIQGCIRGCHNGSVAGMKFLLNQPLMITSGQDNSLKLWIFDASDGSGRLLKSRNAHSEPPTFVKFYGTSGHILLSAGLDRSLRYTSTIRDEQGCEMSQGTLLKKSKSLGVRVEDLRLPPVTFLDSDPTRSNDWDNIVTCHSGSRIVRTWRLQNKCIGKHALGKDITKLKHSTATAAKISSCGNFVIVGYSTGHMEKFNIQSGIHRASFVASNDKAHIKAIKGIASDSVNLVVVSGASDGFIKYWGFKSCKLEYEQKLDYPIRQLILHRESSLMAVAIEDFTVKVIDVDTRKIVRNFTGHQHSITDMAFSPDARWLVTSSMDKSIRLWDLPSARLLDCFLLDSPVTSLAFSPTGDFLATCHLDDIGIYLWSNKTLYSDLFLSPLPQNYVPRRARLPVTIIADESNAASMNETDSLEVTESAANTEIGYESPDQIINEIITLSSLPNSRWKNLLNLKLVKDRNKPKEPPKKPKAAPFFLPTISGLQPKFDTTGKEEDEVSSRVLPSNLFTEKSDFQTLIEESSQEKNYEPVMAVLKEMSPSSIDVEFRSASPDMGGNVKLMEVMLDLFKRQLQSGKDYELIQSYIGLFSKLHGKLIVSEPSLRKLTNEILEVEKATWLRCQELVNQSNCLINYFKSATL